MAVLNAHANVSGPTSIAGRVRGFFQTLFGLALTQYDVSSTRRALHALSDRELDDIGLTRGQIDEVIKPR